MKIVVIGTGYVGLVQGVCLAELGNRVVCIDLDETKILKLKSGKSPIFEPGIEEMIEKNLKSGRLDFDTKVGLHLENVDVIFITVGTPPGQDGRADLKYVLEAAKNIGENLKGYAIVVNKSTVPIGTGQQVKKTIKKYFKDKFDVVSNPEFLREGSALSDFYQPDRIVIGHDNNLAAAKKVAKLYQVLNVPILITSLETAEMIKYASNSFLATQISFINSVANICECVGADVADVSVGMKLDKRIGQRAFLSAGLGYGGSCFPKDVRALIQIAKDNGVDFKILESVEMVNKTQRQKFILKIKEVIGDLHGKRIAIWGIAFKPKTDDVREAPAISIIEALSGMGAEIFAYDPVATENAEKLVPETIFVSHSIDACKKADALVIITEWDEFKQIDLKQIKAIMKQPLIFDGRNIYDPVDMEKLGFKYFSIGR